MIRLHHAAVFLVSFLALVALVACTGVSVLGLLQWNLRLQLAADAGVVGSLLVLWAALKWWR